MMKLPLLRCSFFCFSTIKHVVTRRNYHGKIITATTRVRALSTQSISHHAKLNWVSSLEVPSSIKGQDNTNQISILSWNILAQYLFDSTPQWYQYVAEDAPLSWPERFPRIMDEINTWNADIVCLQEVEFAAYEDLEPAFQCCGYHGVMQSDKKRTGDHAYGVATFYKQDKFDLVDSIHRSRTMVSLLKEKNANGCEDEERIVAVLNCHLEGSPEQSVTRVKQLAKTLQELSSTHTHHNVVVCGDFNCVLGNSACSTYLLQGNCLDEEIEEWGRLVDPEEVSKIPPHPYKFHSAYPVELITESPVDYVTFVSSPHRYTSGLDQIWYHDTSSSVSVKGIKRAFHSPDHKRKILDVGLPSANHPSDHLPVGCILELEETQPILKNLLKKKCLKHKTTVMSESELRETAAKLLDAYPFDSKEQKEDFMYVVGGIYVHKDSRPTECQIQQIRDRRAKKRELFSKVSAENTEILQEIAKLIKAANSRGEK
jgi:mRNA deadenylase 3'-5' endonuclease subunit Ccr4